VTETCDLDGLKVTLVDTAGLRDARDPVEVEGVSRGTRAREIADLIIVVLDGAEALTVEDARLLDETANTTRIVVANKSDRPSAWERAAEMRCVSAATGTGLEHVRDAIVEALTGGEPLRDPAAITNVRHVNLLTRARRSVASACDAAQDAVTPEEFVLADLHAARVSLGEVLGPQASEDVLTHIFDRFCIGK
jgi:tRNA modification GTPase